MVLAVAQDERLGHDHVQVDELAHDPCAGGDLAGRRKEGVGGGRVCLEGVERRRGG